MKPVTRLETLVQAIIEGSDLPFSAVDRIEMFLSDIISGQVSSIAPATRLETYLAKISGQDIDIPTPITRIECFLAAIAGRNLNLPIPITRLEMLLNVWADSASSHTISGPIISFLGKSSTEILGLSVALAPIQDLHGYDRPWAAGAGKNKAYWPTLSNSSSSDVDYTILDDGNTLHVEGTASANSTPWKTSLSSTYADMPLGPYPAGEYTIIANGLVGQNTNDRIAFTARYADGTQVKEGRISGSAVTFTATDEFKIGLYMFISSGTSVNCDVKIQLEKASSLGTWEPYSNICQITGWTGANIYVSPTQNQDDATTYTEDWTSVAGTIYKGSFDSVLGTLTKTQRSSDFQGIASTGITSVSVLGKMTRFWLYDGNALANGNMLCNMAPVVNNTYYASDEIGVTYMSAYPNSIAVKLPKSLVGTTVDSIKTFLQTGAFQMVQDLVAPVEYQLTPQTVSVLVGQNYVWSDAGDVSVTVKNIVPQ